MRRIDKIAYTILLLVTVFCNSAYAESDSELDLFDLSFEELMEMEFYSASKRPEKLSEIPSAVYALSAEDISRAGVQSIPEALRLVPGVQVARTNAGTWAITIRGFNRQYSNKLLVLIDGRSVYTPLYSGVFWELQDYVLDDIDRIEVIRGSGGATWGANAVNGVINIITKEARKTQRSIATFTTGTQTPGILEVSSGGRLEDYNYYRVYGKLSERDDFDKVNGGDAYDGFQKAQAGFRYDFLDKNFNQVTLQGDIYKSRKDLNHYFPQTATTATLNNLTKEDFVGGNVMLKWNFESFGLDSNFSTYINQDYSNTMPALEHRTTTFNAEYQLAGKYDIHSIVAGFEYRFLKDRISNSTYISYDPSSEEVNIFSLYLQDKISIVDNKLYLTLGSKFDHNTYTQFEVQPSAKLLYLLDKNTSIWASVSRSVRTPSRGEHGFNSLAVTGYPLGAVSVTGSSSYDSEKMRSYEIGFRSDITNDFYLDATAFVNNYYDLRTSEAISSSPVVIASFNNGSAENYGFEIFGVYEVSKGLDLRFGYSWLKQNFHKKDYSTDASLERDEGRSPEHQVNFSTLWDIDDEWRWDNHLYYIDDLSYYATSAAVTSKYNIDAYVRYDTNVTYRPQKNVEISLIGQNLLDSSHQEFDEVIYSQASEIPRSFFVRAKVSF